MCSIMGMSKKNITMEAFQNNFAETTSRGPDMEQVIEIGDCYLGFQRLAIMGLTEAGMQPFRLGESAVVCNGELYGFRPEKEALEKVAQDIAVKAYQQAQEQNGGNGANPDGTVDADFSDVQ